MINKIINEILTEPEFVGEIKSLLKQAIITRVKELIHVPQMPTISAFPPAVEVPVVDKVPAPVAEESDVSAQNRRANVLRIAIRQIKPYQSDVEEAVMSGVKISHIAKMLSKPVFYVGSFIHVLGWEWSSTRHEYIPREVEPWQKEIYDSVLADDTEPVPAQEPETAEEPEEIEELETVEESDVAEEVELTPEPEPASTIEQPSVVPEREALIKYQTDMAYLERQKKMIEHHVKKNCSPTKILKKLHPLEKDEYLEIYVSTNLGKRWSSAKCCWI